MTKGDYAAAYPGAASRSIMRTSSSTSAGFLMSRPFVQAPVTCSGTVRISV
jgi:hypothetical protein